MQIINADPRDRRGTRANRAMLSVLHGLSGADGETIAKTVADAKTAVDVATRALEVATTPTSRDGNGIPTWSVGGPNILYTDLPDNFTTNDAGNLDGNRLRLAMYGIVNSRDPRTYFAKINDASAPVEERFAGWIWSRLYSRPGWPDANLFGSIDRTVLDEGKQRYFVNSLNWWTSQVTSLPDSSELLVNRMSDPFAFHQLEEPENNAFSADVEGWTWGSVLGVIAGAAFVWVKRYAAAGRETAVTKAQSDLVTAQNALAAAQQSAVAAGLSTDGTAPGTTGSDKCLPGFQLDPLTNRCVVKLEQKSALPWVLGGAALLGVLFILRRRKTA